MMECSSIGGKVMRKQNFGNGNDDVSETCSLSSLGGCETLIFSAQGHLVSRCQTT